MANSRFNRFNRILSYNLYFCLTTPPLLNHLIVVTHKDQAQNVFTKFCYKFADDSHPISKKNVQTIEPVTNHYLELLMKWL